MAEWWIKDYCPKCNEVNWIEAGDLMEITEGVDGMECRVCSFRWLFRMDALELEERGIEEVSPGQFVGDVTIKDGISGPGEAIIEQPTKKKD